MAVTSLPKKGSLFRRQHIFAGTTLAPIMIYMMIFTLIPMLWGVLITFFRYSPTRASTGFLGLGGSNPFVGLNNYLDLFSNSTNGQLFRTSFKNTLIFSFLYLPLNLVVCLPLAMLIESVALKPKRFSARSSFCLPLPQR